MLTCSKCGEEKSLDLFPKKGRCCKACKAVIDAAYVKANKDKVQARKNAWQNESRKKARLASPRQMSAYQIAKAAGQKKYNNNEPCKEGHLSDRWVRSRGCIECERLRALAYKQVNRESLLPKKRAYAKVRNETHKDVVRAIAKKVYDSRSDEQKKRSAELAKNWRLRNKGKVLSWTRSRQLAKIQRTPAWLTEFDKLKIECYYSIAAMLTRVNEEPWHVDHVLPLRGKTVSGLHVPNNLQLLRGKENSRKGNRV